MRFKCANLNPIFLRSCRHRLRPLVPASDRSTSRACSWITRGILRDVSFGQHCGLRGQVEVGGLSAAMAKRTPGELHQKT